MAQKWGNCHVNWTKNNTPGSNPNEFVWAMAPSIGGIAPGKAPTNTDHGVILFMGVYKKTYDRSLVSEQDYEYEKCLQEDREKELKKIATEDIAAENNNKEITTEDSENDVTIKKIDDEEIYLTKEELREARLKFFS